MTTVWVPQDSSARAVGADEVAAALAHVEGVTVRRNGTRGMLWREPLVEVETERGRVATPRSRPTAYPTWSGRGCSPAPITRPASGWSTTTRGSPGRTG
ncbi:hypothetical protein [Serinicoccus sp. CNJ-927]|uniref:hypothetical protein n=1 Tax=Serinicoccus sp. CNJ-927 TaxID=1904970 RepID=UPI001EDC13D0|nr:hypothetical protein [Serinicoccus sp. CNJ-927]